MWVVGDIRSLASVPLGAWREVGQAGAPGSGPLEGALSSPQGQPLMVEAWGSHLSHILQQADVDGDQA